MGTKPIKLLQPTETTNLPDNLKDGAPEQIDNVAEEPSPTQTMSADMKTEETGAITPRKEVRDTLEVSPKGAILVGTNAYNQGKGIFIGRDGDAYKISIGADLTYDGSTLSVSGDVEVGSLHIPDQDTTANSFHVNTTGDAWWGVTESTFDADNENAPAYVLKDGTAKFSSGKVGSWSIGTSTLTSGQIKLDASSEQILIGSATAPLSGKGVFIGKDGSDYEIRAGDPNDQYFHWDGQSSVEVKARLTYRNPFTAGATIEVGDVIAIESDDKIYPSRATDITDGNIDQEVNSSGVSGGETVLIDGGIALTANTDGSTSEASRIIYDAENKTITSIENATTISTATASSHNQPALARLTSTTCLFAVEADGDVYVQVLTGLDSGITANTETTLSTATRPRLVRVSDTQGLIMYTTSSSDLEVRKVDVSGTSVSLGAAQSVDSLTLIQSRDFVRYGDSEYYAISYTDNTGSGAGDRPVYIRTIQWDGTSFTVGDRTLLEGSGFPTPRICGLTNTKLAGTDYNDTGGSGFELRAFTVTRSGTDTTVNSKTVIRTVTDGTGGEFESTQITRLGRDTAVIYHLDDHESPSSDGSRIVLISIDGTSVSQLGSVETVTTSSVGGFWRGSCVHAGPDSMLLGVNLSSGDIRYQLASLETNLNTVIGLSAEAGGDTDSLACILFGFSDAVSGLDTAKKYYTWLDGELKDYGTQQFGVALSSGSIKVTI